MERRPSRAEPDVGGRRVGLVRGDDAIGTVVDNRHDITRDVLHRVDRRGLLPVELRDDGLRAGRRVHRDVVGVGVERVLEVRVLGAAPSAAAVRLPMLSNAMPPLIDSKKSSSASVWNVSYWSGVASPIVVTVPSAAIVMKLRVKRARRVRVEQVGPAVERAVVELDVADVVRVESCVGDIADRRDGAVEADVDERGRAIDVAVADAVGDAPQEARRIEREAGDRVVSLVGVEDRAEVGRNLGERVDRPQLAADADVAAAIAVRGEQCVVSGMRCWPSRCSSSPSRGRRTGCRSPARCRRSPSATPRPRPPCNPSRCRLGRTRR